MRIFTVVDLPAPFGPRNPRISPGSTRIDSDCERDLFAVDSRPGCRVRITESAYQCGSVGARYRIDAFSPGYPRRSRLSTISTALPRTFRRRRRPAGACCSTRTTVIPTTASSPIASIARCPTGLPLAIEQDLVWCTDPATKTPRSIVSHGEPIRRHRAVDEGLLLRARASARRAGAAREEDASSGR